MHNPNPNIYGDYSEHVSEDLKQKMESMETEIGRAKSELGTAEEKSRYLGMLLRRYAELINISADIDVDAHVKEMIDMHNRYPITDYLSGTGVEVSALKDFAENYRYLLLKKISSDV